MSLDVLWQILPLLQRVSINVLCYSVTKFTFVSLLSTTQLYFSPLVVKTYIWKSFYPQVCARFRKLFFSKTLSIVYFKLPRYTQYLCATRGRSPSVHTNRVCIGVPWKIFFWNSESVLVRIRRKVTFRPKWWQKSYLTYQYTLMYTKKKYYLHIGPFRMNFLYTSCKR